MTQTMMAREIAEIPAVTARQLGEGLSAYQAIGRILRDRAPCLPLHRRAARRTMPRPT
ncbi:hypothetical protein [Neoaquamicrobium sediminum]|uniref:hypothetical protein n=1 Tax=Neoaquamicrobium sediminum TaxID=1849104 RepID=UPI0015640C31|nr:hypothetical protein [Mesorhizobium sediminum]NRC54006.1 hypothetical protein [Mesorhizobium sediminum]